MPKLHRTLRLRDYIYIMTTRFEQFGIYCNYPSSAAQAGMGQYEGNFHLVRTVSNWQVRLILLQGSYEISKHGEQFSPGAPCAYCQYQ